MNAVAHRTHCHILGRYECAKEKLHTFWGKLHVYLNLKCELVGNQQSQTPRFLMDLFHKFPLLLYQFSKLQWNLERSERLVRTKLVRQLFYAQVKRLKAKERKAKSELLHSTRFNAFTYIVFRGKGINLDFTRARVLEYLE